MKEDQDHLTECAGYKDLRGEADLVNETELVNFFGKVIGRREENREFSRASEKSSDPLRNYLSV